MEMSYSVHPVVDTNQVNSMLHYKPFNMSLLHCENIITDWLTSSADWLTDWREVQTGWLTYWLAVQNNRKSRQTDRKPIQTERTSQQTGSKCRQTDMKFRQTDRMFRQTGLPTGYWLECDQWANQTIHSNPQHLSWILQTIKRFVHKG